MSIDELLNSVSGLSHAEKFRLARFVLEQLAIEDGAVIREPAQPNERFDPRRFFGAAHESRQAIDDYLASLREGWN